MFTHYNAFRPISVQQTEISHSFTIVGEKMPCINYPIADILSVYFDAASFCHVSTTESGFSEIDPMPSFISHWAKSG